MDGLMELELNNIILIMTAIQQAQCPYTGRGYTSIKLILTILLLLIFISIVLRLQYNVV